MPCNRAQLNMTVSNAYITDKVREMDVNGDGVLQFSEFVNLMRALGERPEVGAVRCGAVLKRSC